VSPKFQALTEAAASREHGCRARYMSGCRCVPCRAANSRYEGERRKARESGDWNGIVNAWPAREHIAKLSRAGVGHKTVADIVRTSSIIIQEIATGKRKRIRARTERLILAVDTSMLADGARVPAGKCRRLLDELIADGYTKTWLAAKLGSTAKQPMLQFNREQVTARNALRIERLYRAIREGRVQRP
jgi:hypothetical protein